VRTRALDAGHKASPRAEAPERGLLLWQGGFSSSYATPVMIWKRLTISKERAFFVLIERQKMLFALNVTRVTE
jgi:hypothetical protein